MDATDLGGTVRGFSIGGLIVVIWLIIGAIAAGQRGYYSGSDDSCAKLGTTLVTIVAGPLNYVGANPKVKCDLPEPSK
jgi:hypothetical protein